MSLDALIEAVAPLWGAEAEICRTYFRSPRRTADSDAEWLARQAAKELVDGVQPRAEDLQRLLASVEADLQRLGRLAAELHEEAAHLGAFADAYEQVRPPGRPHLGARLLAELAQWPENVALREMRQRHVRDHGELGAVAGAVTEGGCCTLFSEGAALADDARSDADRIVASACRAVLDDELDHMLAGLAALRDRALSGDQWDLVTELTVEQSRSRLHMRNAQLGLPVPPRRMDELVAGEAEPVPVDRSVIDRASSTGGSR